MMDWIDCNGVALRFDLSGGGGRVLVLVHEMGGTLESWEHVLPVLAMGRRVLRYDTRGAGQSEKARGTLTFEAMADDLLGLLDALGIEEAVDLAGCAVGAGIALAFAARHPGRVARLVAMSPAIGVAPERREATLRFAAEVERAGMRAVLEESFAGSYPPEVRFDADHFRRFRARWLANDPQSYAVIYRMLAMAELEPSLAAIRCPVLVLAGTHDRLRPPKTVFPIAEILRAQRAVLPTGHFMATQTPGLVADAMLGFLNE